MEMPSFGGQYDAIKRPVIYIGDDQEPEADNGSRKRRRPSLEFDIRFSKQRPLLESRGPHAPPATASSALPEFIVLREIHPPAVGAADVLERTATGLSICADTVERSASTELLEDHEAAQRVREHIAYFRRRFPDSKHERILRSIIDGRTCSAVEYAVDADALESIFSAANELFFNGRLTQRVVWDWSHNSSSQYDSGVIGTTALRRAGSSKRGFETLIVLSSPMLRDGRYSRRLLISTFLHELIHSYLFICCGFRARHRGGHTQGFYTIAKLIDDWAGPDSLLYLSKIEADLDHFRDDEGRPSVRNAASRNTNVLDCSGSHGYDGDSWDEEPRHRRHLVEDDDMEPQGSQYVYLCSSHRRDSSHRF
jgi:hypothetical protein